MDAAALTALVQRTALDLGFDAVGVLPVGSSPDVERYRAWLAAGYAGEMAYLDRRSAERSDLRALLPEANTVILLTARYTPFDLPPSLAHDPSRGLIAAYAWGLDYHEVLKPLLFQLDAVLRSASGRTTLGYGFVDTAPVLERSWAAAAGLGFIGKNTCLIDPDLGSWLFIAGLLVPEALAPAPWPGRLPWQPADVAPVGHPHAEGADAHRRRRRSTCGACTRCLQVCPTAAFPAAHVLDARRCISYLTIELRGPIPAELRPLMGNWVFGCDLCQAVCPWNRRYARPPRLAAFQPDPDRVAPKLLDLLALDEAGFRRRFRRSPVLRAKRRGLLRNVCVALGNWADPAAVPGLREALQDAEALVRGHAAWALGRIGTADAVRALEQRVAVETDSWVRHEILSALGAR